MATPARHTAHRTRAGFIPAQQRTRSSLATLLLCALAACASPGPDSQFSYTPPTAPAAPEGASGFTPKPGWQAQRFMVAAANPLATDAGYQVLKAGGSALDAAIAVQMVLGLVEPQSSGIGGGAFLMHWDGKHVQAFDGRETAPAAATPELFLRDGKPLPFLEAVIGGRSVGTPGALRMLEMAHREHGKLPWKDLFAPAIRLAEDGFLVSPRLATMLAAPEAKTLRNDPDMAAYFFNPDGSPRAAGTRLKNPELAKVLRDIAAKGSSAFYEGSVARDIVAKVRKHPTNPGLLSEADLAGYKPKQREALCTDYRVYRLCGMPPPSSGALAIAQMLAILDHTDIVKHPPVQADFGLEPSPQAVHLFSEAGRLAYADRNRYVADPDFVPLPGGSAASLLDPAYIKSRAALIGERSMGVARPGTPAGATLALADDRSPELPSTSHISVVDAQGRAVAMTTTIENGFGAQMMVRGFLLNNQLTDFSFLPAENGQPIANRVQPNKRPRSSMAPTLVFMRNSGALSMSVGSPGGSAIINYVGKTLVGTLDWGLDAQQAISLPNFGSRNGPTELEQGRSSAALADGLKARGHDVRVIVQTSGLQAIQRSAPEGKVMWFGGADPRREGVVMGD
ncbi:MAG: gamma-glutamyltransferase [Moraxellaceae bacterium]|nr:gamma-glutamyltransferase [Moraxellaceae bacterium]